MLQFVIIERQIESEERGVGSHSLDVGELRQINLLSTIFERDQQQKPPTPTSQSQRHPRGFGDQSSKEISQMSQTFKSRIGQDNTRQDEEKQNWFNKLFGKNKDSQKDLKNPKKGKADKKDAADLVMKKGGSEQVRTPSSQQLKQTSLSMQKSNSRPPEVSLNMTSSSMASARLSLGASELFQSTTSSAPSIKLTTISLLDAYGEARSLLEEMVGFFEAKLGSMTKNLEFEKSEVHCL